MRNSDYVDPEKAATILHKLTPQNRLVCELMAATGFRVGDIVALKRADLERAQKRGWLTITEQKTGKTRSVLLPRELREKALVLAGDIYVFPHRSDANKHRSRTTVAKQLKKYRPANDKIISPHSFRKQYAVRQFQKCNDMDKLQRNLNHTHKSTTTIYAVADILSAAKRRA